MNCLEEYRDMVSLRGLTGHTVKSYSTYIRAYLEYLESISMAPENADWQLRFFTMYVMHKSWDETQLSMRKFDTYLPYVSCAILVQLGRITFK